jgi:hypothetical protein
MSQISIDYTIGLDNIIGFLSILVATSSLYLGLTTIGRQISVYIFNEYSQRYHEIMRRLPVQIWTTHNVTLSSLPEEQIQQVLIDYGDFFRLLAGERHLKTLRFIDAKTWKLWVASTRQIMSQPISRDAWKRLRSSFNYDPNFQKFVDGYVS